MSTTTTPDTIYDFDDEYDEISEDAPEEDEPAVKARGRSQKATPATRIAKLPVGTSLSGVASLPGLEPAQGVLTVPDFEERWTGGYIFENEWQSFRTRQNRVRSPLPG